MKLKLVATTFVSCVDRVFLGRRPAAIDSAPPVRSHASVDRLADAFLPSFFVVVVVVVVVFFLPSFGRNVRPDCGRTNRRGPSVVSTASMMTECNTDSM